MKYTFYREQQEVANRHWASCRRCRVLLVWKGRRSQLFEFMTTSTTSTSHHHTSIHTSRSVQFTSYVSVELHVVFTFRDANLK